MQASLHHGTLGLHVPYTIVGLYSRPLPYSTKSKGIVYILQRYRFLGPVLEKFEVHKMITSWKNQFCIMLPIELQDTELGAGWYAPIILGRFDGQVFIFTTPYCRLKCNFTEK